MSVLDVAHTNSDISVTHTLVLIEKDSKTYTVYYSLMWKKTYDRVPREELYWCMRDNGVPEKYIRLVKVMYHQCETVVRGAPGTTEPFAVEVGLHQGSAFSPFLFAITMDSLTENIRQKSSWHMMFEDDVVLCAREKGVLELEL